MNRFHSCCTTGRGTARQCALHLSHTSTHARTNRTIPVLRFFLEILNAEIERNGVKTTREYNPRAAFLCSGFVFLNPEERPEYLYTPQSAGKGEERALIPGPLPAFEVLRELSRQLENA